MQPLSDDFQVEMSLYKEACLGFSAATVKRFPAVATKTVAIDFDGTISRLAPDLGHMGEPMPFAKAALEEFKRQGWQVIIHTVRTDLFGIKKWLDDYFIPFDAINCNPVDVAATGMMTTKPYAQIYVDDRAWPMCGVFAGWCTIMSDLYQKGILESSDEAFCEGL